MPCRLPRLLLSENSRAADTPAPSRQRLRQTRSTRPFWRPCACSRMSLPPEWQSRYLTDAFDTCEMRHTGHDRTAPQIDAVFPDEPASWSIQGSCIFTINVGWIPTSDHVVITSCRVWDDPGSSLSKRGTVLQSFYLLRGNDILGSSFLPRIWESSAFLGVVIGDDCSISPGLVSITSLDGFSKSTCDKRSNR